MGLKGTAMADHQTADHGNGMDYAEHEETYRFFVGLTKYGTLAVVVLLILMSYFLVH